MGPKKQTKKIMKIPFSAESEGQASGKEKIRREELHGSPSQSTSWSRAAIRVGSRTMSRAGEGTSLGGCVGPKRDGLGTQSGIKYAAVKIKAVN